MPCGRGVALQRAFLQSRAQAKEETEAETKGKDVSGLAGKGMASKGSEGQLGLSLASFPQNAGWLGAGCWVTRVTGPREEQQSVLQHSIGSAAAAGPCVGR